MSAKVWFITGTSRGFGREWALAALERGDSVVATARDSAALDDLVAAHGDAVLPLALDVTDREAVFAAVARAHENFGRLDVVVNNAGYGQFGMVEELSEAESASRSRPTCSGRSGSPRRRCRSSAPRAAVISCRSPPSAGSPPFPPSASTTPPSGRWRG